MAYGDFKDLFRITASDKVLHNKVFTIAKNPNYDGYQCALASVVYKCLIKSLLVVLLQVNKQKPWLREINLPLKLKSCITNN